jgi:multidrug efflux pump subunit AcrA (membrane-fusion protein)
MGHTFREAESEFDAAQLALDRHQIHAPSDGRILHLHAQPGKKRMLQTEDPDSALIVELYRPTDMQARIDVPLNEAAGLAVGQPVKLSTDLLSDLTLEGHVTRITGQADIQRNTLQVKVAIENPDDRLRPEMLVRARFFPLPKENPKPEGDEGESNGTQSRLPLYAPADALFDLNDNSAKAWVVDSEQRARQRTLTLGNTRKDGYREVREGLHAGEQVVLPPFANLSDGTRLEPQITEISS